MPEHSPVSDETVRYRGDAPDGRPPVDGVRHAARTPPPADDELPGGN